MSISNLYPLGTNTEALTTASFISNVSHGPGFTGGSLATTVSSLDIGKTFNTAMFKWARLTATLTTTNAVQMVFINDPKYNPSSTLATDQIIGTAYIDNITAGTHVVVPVLRALNGGGVPANTLSISTETFNITSGSQYDISYFITYPRE